MGEYEVKWIKLGVNTFDDEKIRLIEGIPNMGESIENIWIKMLCLAGKINDNGYIYFSKVYDEEYNPEYDNEGNVKAFSEEQLAILFNKPVDIIKMAIKTFIHFEMITVDDFGVIFLNDFYKEQSIHKLASMKKQKSYEVKLIQQKVENGIRISEAEREILKREQTRIRVKRYRERKKCNAVTQIDKCNKI